VIGILIAIISYHQYKIKITSFHTVEVISQQQNHCATPMISLKKNSCWQIGSYCAVCHTGGLAGCTILPCL